MLFGHQSISSLEGGRGRLLLNHHHLHSRLFALDIIAEEAEAEEAEEEEAEEEEAAAEGAGRKKSCKTRVILCKCATATGRNHHVEIWVEAAAPPLHLERPEETSLQSKFSQPCRQ